MTVYLMSGLWLVPERSAARGLDIGLSQQAAQDLA
jgi:hypothetical protein